MRLDTDLRMFYQCQSESGRKSVNSKPGSVNPEPCGGILGFLTLLIRRELKEYPINHNI